MNKQNHSFSGRLASPFKGLVKGTRKVTAGFVNFCRNDELQELSESLDKSMEQIAVSLEKIKKSAEKYRELSEVITACKHATAFKYTGQNLENISKEIAGKNKELEEVAIEARRNSYLKNGIWQNRLN
jgi:methyl-accepting chemotaxis protein